jgi:hypothetical protein
MSNKTIRYFSVFIKKIPDLSGKERKILLERLRKKTLRNRKIIQLPKENQTDRKKAIGKLKINTTNWPYLKEFNLIPIKF